MNAIVPTTAVAPLNYSDLERLANNIAKSGLFGIRTPDQAMALMMIAAAEGRHPALAARDYDIVNGRPTKKAEAMLRDFVQAGGKVQWHALNDNLADATFTHPQTGSVRIDWDMKRAQTAFGKKDMYAKFPRQMLRSRVVSEGVRTLWPLATSGMYVEEEIGHLPPHAGPTIEAAAEPIEVRTGAPTPPPEPATAPVTPPTTAPDFILRRPASPRKRTWGEWLNAFELEMAAVEGEAELEKILSRDDVRMAQDRLTNGALDRYNDAVKKALGRVARAEDAAEGELEPLDPFAEPLPA